MQLDLTAIVKGGEPFAQVLRRNTHHWAAMAIEVSDRNETVHVVLVPHQHPWADSAIGAADNPRNRPEQIFHRLHLRIAAQGHPFGLDPLSLSRPAHVVIMQSALVVPYQKIAHGDV